MRSELGASLCVSAPAVAALATIALALQAKTLIRVMASPGQRLAHSIRLPALRCARRELFVQSSNALAHRRRQTPRLPANAASRPSRAANHAIRISMTDCHLATPLHSHLGRCPPLPPGTIRSLDCACAVRQHRPARSARRATWRSHLRPWHPCLQAHRCSAPPTSSAPGGPPSQMRIRGCACGRRSARACARGCDPHIARGLGNGRRPGVRERLSRRRRRGTAAPARRSHRPAGDRAAAPGRTAPRDA